MATIVAASITCKRCGNESAEDDLKSPGATLTKKDKILLGLAAFDGIVIITTLVLGILSILSVISLSGTGTLSLLAVAGAFIITWATAALMTKGKFFLQLKWLMQAAIANCKPKSSSQLLI